MTLSAHRAVRVRRTVVCTRLRRSSLATQQLEALRDRNDLDTSKVDDVILGCVHQVKGQGADIARSAVITANWDEACAGLSINRFCASGLEAVNIAGGEGYVGYE